MEAVHGEREKGMNHHVTIILRDAMPLQITSDKCTLSRWVHEYIRPGILGLLHDEWFICDVCMFRYSDAIAFQVQADSEFDRESDAEWYSPSRNSRGEIVPCVPVDWPPNDRD